MPATLEAPTEANPFADLIPKAPTDYGQFSDLVPSGLTSGASLAGQEDYGLFSDLVPKSPTAETEKAVAETPVASGFDKTLLDTEKSIPPFHQAMNAARSLAASAGKYIFEGLQGFEQSRARMLANPPSELTKPQGDELVLPDGSVMSKEQQDALEQRYHDAAIAQIPDAKAKADFFKQLASNTDTAMYVDPALANTVPARIAHAAGSAGVLALESLVPYAGVPFMVFHGALATEAEYKNVHPDAPDSEAEAAGVRSAIGLALFGGASKLAALGVAKLLPDGASSLTKFLSQFTGQEVANETSSRAINAWEKASDAPEGKKIEAALNALKDTNLEQSTLNTVYALAHASKAAERAPARPEAAPEPSEPLQTTEIPPAMTGEPIEQAPMAEVLKAEPSVFRAMSEDELRSSLQNGRIQSQSAMALPIEKALGLTAFGDSKADVGMYTNLNLQQHGKSYIVEVSPSADLRSDWTHLPELLKERAELQTETEQLRQTISDKGPEWENRQMFTDWLEQNKKRASELEAQLKELSHSATAGDLPRGIKLPYRQTPKGVSTDRITRITEVTPQGERDVTSQFGFPAKADSPVSTSVRTSRPIDVASPRETSPFPEAAQNPPVASNENAQQNQNRVLAQPEIKPSTTKPSTGEPNAIQIRSAETQIPRPTETGQDQPIGSEGMGRSEQGTETAGAPQAKKEPIGVADAIAEIQRRNEPSTTGIAQRVHDVRASEGRQGEILPGEGVTSEDMVNRGRELLNAGADPEKIIAGVSAGSAVTGDQMAVLRARHEQFSNATDQAADALRKTPNDPVAKQAYENAFKAETNFAQHIKPAATEWHKVGQSMQGETDIQTGTFTGLRRAFHAITGRDVTPREAVKLDNTATKVQKANSAVEKTKADFSEVVKTATKNTLPKTAAELRAHFAEKFKAMLPC
jgi:hypothetical protein